jgi:cellulose synthase/poly-beta-1,6-N-acetylglucosamine synthase-like glycosyltransferase
MKFLFVLSVVVIVYTYLGYPVFLWIVARLRPRAWRSAPMSPTVSIVLAVHNGHALLQEKINHLLALSYPNVSEIVIVSDGSTDATAELLRSQTHPNVVGKILETHSGKAAAINAGVAEATGDVLVFVDIRPEIGEGAVERLVSNFADPQVGCVSGNLQLRQEGHDAAAGAVGGLYWRYEQWIRTCEARVHSPVGVYGGFYAIRRQLFTPQPVGTILDDMFQPLSIIQQGYRSVVDLNAYVYDRWPKKTSVEFQRKVRTLAGNYQLFQMEPKLLTPANPVWIQLISHKLMRLLVPYFLVILLISSSALAPGSVFFTAFSVGQLAIWSLAAIALRVSIPFVSRLMAPASALLVLNAAAVVGLYKFFFTRGPLWKIWTSGPTVTAAAGPVSNARST